MNFLFWTVLVVLIISAIVQWWLRRSSPKRTSTRKVLAFTRNDKWPLEDGNWSIDDVDFLATSERIRAVVTLNIDNESPSRRREAMEFLAHEIYRQAEVEAVFVQAQSDREGLESYLFAADGRGWWGGEIISTAFSASTD